MNDLDISPAPWSAIKADKFHGEYVIDANGYTVCDLYFMKNGDVIKHGHNTVANARLIQAAPKMYDFLEDAADLLLQNNDLDAVSTGQQIRKLLAEIRGN